MWRGRALRHFDPAPARWPRLCRGRKARRLCRASHQRVGLPRRDPAGPRSWRIRERLSRRRAASTKGNPLIACAPGVKDALIAAARLRGDRAMSEIILTTATRARRSRLLGAEARSWRVGGRDLLWPGDPAIWQRHQSDPLSGRRLDARRRGAGRRRHAIRSACTALRGSRPSPSKPQSPTSRG